MLTSLLLLSLAHSTSHAQEAPPATEGDAPAEAPALVAAATTESAGSDELGIFRVSLANVMRTHVSQSVSDSVAPKNFRSDGFFGPGFAVAGTFNVDALWTADFRYRNALFPIDGDADLSSGLSSYWSLGATRKHELRGIEFHGGVWLVKNDAMVSLWADSGRQKVATVTKGLYGLQIGGGVNVDTRFGGLTAELGESIYMAGFVPAPAETWITLDLELNRAFGFIPDGWAGTVGYDYHFRNLAWQVDDVNSHTWEGDHSLRFGIVTHY